MDILQIRNQSLAVALIGSIVSALFLYLFISSSEVHARSNAALEIDLQSPFELKDSVGHEKVKLMALYGGAGFGFGREGTPAGWFFTSLLSNNWGVSFNHRNRALIASNIPFDYQPSQGSSLNPNSSSSDNSSKHLPNEYYNFYALMLVREGTTNSKNVRYGIEAGPCWVWTRTSTFVPTNAVFSSSWFGSAKSSNYSEVHHYRQYPGFSLKAKLEFPFSEIFGLELALMGNINKARSFMGVEINMTLGMVRRPQIKYSSRP